MKSKLRRTVERLEQRVCLTVNASLTDSGDLLVGGDADGAVEISTTDGQTYQVTDNGVALEAVSGVTGGVRVTLDQTARTANDSVTIDLGGQSIKRLIANLADGDNTLTVRNGTVKGNLSFVGGTGADQLTLADSLIVQRSVAALLGAGSNIVTVDGQVDGDVHVHGREGDDVVHVGAGAKIGRGLSALLGDGNNSIDAQGEIGRGLMVRTGAGADSVQLAESSQVGSVRLQLGDGDNSLTSNGNVSGSIGYCGGAGTDAVTLADTSLTGGSVRIGLGDGVNTVLQAGAVSGDLSVRSQNADDVVTTDATMVGGTVTTELGVDTMQIPQGRFEHHGPHMPPGGMVPGATDPGAGTTSGTGTTTDGSTSASDTTGSTNTAGSSDTTGANTGAATPPTDGAGHGHHGFGREARGWTGMAMSFGARMMRMFRS